MKKQIKCLLPVVRHYHGDLQKKWHIEFYFLNPGTGKLDRLKKYEGINHHQTRETRLAAANRLCEQYAIKLKEGWSPFDNARILYTNQTIYERDQWKGRQMQIDYSIEYFLNAVIDKRTAGLRKKSKQTYLSKLRTFLQWLQEHRLQNMHISSFTADHARRFLKHLLKTRCHSTHNYYIDLMRSFWSDIMQHNKNLLTANPWQGLAKLRHNVKKRTPFRSHQVEAIKKHLTAHDPYMWFICQVIYYTYIRPCQELTNVRVKDVDLDSKVIRLQADYSKNRKTQPVRLPEPICTQLVALDIYKYPEDYYLFGTAGPSRKKAGRDHFSKRFKKTLNALNIKGYSIYCWKDTGNRNAVLAGISIKEIQMQNRHHSLEVTDRYLQSLTVSDSEKLFSNYPEI